MGKALEFLQTLDEVELLYFAKFKLPSYTPQLQSEIRSLLERKNISVSTIARFQPSRLPYADFDQTHICPQCGSNKLLVNTVEWTETPIRRHTDFDTNPNQLFQPEAIFKDEVICNVCDFWLQDPNKRGPYNPNRKKLYWRGLMKKWFR